MTEIAPGMVETEFSLVRFDGDAERAAGVYDGHRPADRRGRRRADRVLRHPPRRVDVDYVSVKPTAQATAKIAHRRE